MTRQTRIPLETVPAGVKGRLVSVDGEDVAVFRPTDEVFAVGNVCPHQHHSRIHEGMLEGTIVTCPMHGWSFDIRTGACVNGSGSLRRYKVTLNGNEVVVELPGS